MRFKEPYILFKKTIQSGKKIYYVSFYDARGKRRQLSTGQTRKAFAEQIAVKLYFEGKFFPNIPNQLYSGQNSITPQNIVIAAQTAIPPAYPTFSEYTVDWFDYDKCDYIREKLVHGFHYTPNHAYRMKEYLNIRITPFFGSYRIIEIDEFIVEKSIEKLKLEEKQIEFEKEVAAKNEQFMKDALNKIESESEAGGQELGEQDEECEFGDVDEFVQDDSAEESEFAEVSEFVQDEQELGEQDEECEFGDVDEFAEQDVSAKEDDFAEVSEFVQDEQELSEQDEECEFGDVGEFAEQDDSVEESEFAEVSEFVQDEQETPLAGNDFTNLRNIFDYLPENGRDTFVSNRIRMVVEYVIAKTSGKRGLLKTAKMWRKNAYEDPLVNPSEEDKVTAKEICDLLEYLKTLANNLEDKDISKAICESADNVIQRINY